jgi:uncharacterized metal-binding protein
MAVDCADCVAHVCSTGHRHALPDKCPMHDEFPEFDHLYPSGRWRELAYQAALVEAEGYGRWCRAREIAELSRRMGYRRLGLAHCKDMGREARLTGDYLSSFDLETIVPVGEDCDPEGQAMLFQNEGTELNVLCGLCVGHDSIFIQSSRAPVTSLVVRDNRLQHNPAAALYTSDGYFRHVLYRKHLREDGPSPFRGLDTATLDAASRAIVAEGGGSWCRVEEAIELAYRTGARRLGIVFCTGFADEARILKRIVKAHGFYVSSSCCKTGSVPKEDLGILDSQKIRPGGPEMICNPLAQAELLNREKVHLVLLLGQCVGHDSATMAHLDAPAVCIVAKDRVLAHNTVGALYARSSKCDEI